MRTEKEILNDFEKLGYNRVKLLGANFYIQNSNIGIEINTYYKKYEKYEYGIKTKLDCFLSQPITMKEHKLLNELFELWGWLDNEKETKRKSNYDKVLELLSYAGVDEDFLIDFDTEIQEIVDKLNAYDLIRAARKEEDKNEKSTNSRNN